MISKKGSLTSAEAYRWVKPTSLYPLRIIIRIFRIFLLHVLIIAQWQALHLLPFLYAHFVKNKRTPCVLPSYYEHLTSNCIQYDLNLYVSFSGSVAGANVT